VSMYPILTGQKSQPSCVDLRQIVIAGAVASMTIWTVAINAQTVSLQPTAGETYDYGVEYRIVEQTDEQRQPLLIRKRCRLRFVITDASESGWTARYMTIPFSGSKPATSKNRLDVSIARTRKSYEGQDLVRSMSRGPQFPPGQGPSAAGRQIMNDASRRMELIRQRSAAFRKETYRRRIVEFDHYPGLFRFCEGTVTVNSQGEFVSGTGDGNLPFATGHIAHLIFLELPIDGNTESGFSSRSVNPIVVSSLQGNEVKSSEMSVLSILSPRDASATGLLAFDRDVETSGGVTAGNKITLSGTGVWEYAEKLRMPYAGSMDYETEGLTYVGVAKKFKVRIGFHYLHGIRAALFDNDLLPTLDALEAKNLPRIENRQRATMQKLWNTKPDAMRGRGYDTGADVQLQKFALTSAPPPLDSSLQRTIDKLIANQDSLVMFRNGGKSMGKEEQIRQLARISARWIRLRELATHVLREWSDVSGTSSITAKLISIQADSVALQRVDNNQRIEVPFDRLSADDVEFAKSFGLPAREPS
jgi:hypothetical protein